MLAGTGLALAALAYVLHPLLKAIPRPPGDSLSPSPTVRTCSVCGTRPEPDAVFCSNCGRTLESG